MHMKVKLKTTEILEITFFFFFCQYLGHTKVLLESLTIPLISYLTFDRSFDLQF